MANTEGKTAEESLSNRFRSSDGYEAVATSHRPETGSDENTAQVCASPCGDHMPLLFHALTSEMQLSSVGRGADRRAPRPPS
ncbi:unnamed protein product [Arctogadus glacialis]